MPVLYCIAMADVTAAYPLDFEEALLAQELGRRAESPCLQIHRPKEIRDRIAHQRIVVDDGVATVAVWLTVSGCPMRDTITASCSGDAST